MANPVVIVGAGLAGLTCAKHLAARGIEFVLLDGADEVGGRVRTDEMDGFRLDRGFQVLLTGYPEAQNELDYDQLQLRRFEPGSLVQIESRAIRLSDPGVDRYDYLKWPFPQLGAWQINYESFAFDCVHVEVVLHKSLRHRSVLL